MSIEEAIKQSEKKMSELHSITDGVKARPGKPIPEEVTRAAEELVLEMENYRVLQNRLGLIKKMETL